MLHRHALCLRDRSEVPRLGQIWTPAMTGVPVVRGIWLANERQRMRDAVTAEFIEHGVTGAPTDHPDEHGADGRLLRQQGQLAPVCWHQLPEGSWQTYACAGWHTAGLDGRDARYGRGMRTADGTAGAPKTA